jgi:hypothetical protein
VSKYITDRAKEKKEQGQKTRLYKYYSITGLQNIIDIAPTLTNLSSSLIQKSHE